MFGNTSSIIKDQDIQILIDWLGTKDTLGKEGINLTITVIQGLMQDRGLLLKALAATAQEEPKQDV